MRSNEPLIFFHLKLVGKISLGVGMIAVLSLLLSLALVSGETGDSYVEIIRSNSVTRGQLATVMLLIGLMLVAIAGVITWMIALYSSFRVAGPLYRFSKNLRLASASNHAPLVALRNDDSLHEQAENIGQAVMTLREHYALVENAAADASAALARGDAAAYAEAVARLKALDGEVRV